MKIAESKIRFYDPNTLNIVTEVMRSKPKELEDGTVLTHRDPTLTDAKKSGLLPSVTSIIKDIVNPASLVQWIEEDCIKVAAAYPYAGDGSQEDIDERYMPMIKGKRKEYAKTVQDKGKLLHKEKEVFFMEGKEPETMEGKNVVADYNKFMVAEGADPGALTCEQPFGSKLIGYAGTPDDYFADINMINDLKTTKHKNFEKIKTSKHLYMTWKLQLGAYRIIAPTARLMQAVCSQETGETKFIELDNPDTWAEAFKGIFTAWCAEKDYDPRSA